mmetsp:Transcript_11025/g.17330  ORF Transcript_11025/g.17330 Transcript_11025/m.17330 type:complete len:170 (-) Transcript_11025:560-1069(-)
MGAANSQTVSAELDCGCCRFTGHTEPQSSWTRREQKAGDTTFVGPIAGCRDGTQSPVNESRTQGRRRGSEQRSGSPVHRSSRENSPARQACQHGQRHEADEHHIDSWSAADVNALRGSATADALNHLIEENYKEQDEREQLSKGLEHRRHQMNSSYLHIRQYESPSSLL